MIVGQYRWRAIVRRRTHPRDIDMAGEGGDVDDAALGWDYERCEGFRDCQWGPDIGVEDALRLLYHALIMKVSNRLCNSALTDIRIENGHEIVTARIVDQIFQAASCVLNTLYGSCDVAGIGDVKLHSNHVWEFG